MYARSESLNPWARPKWFAAENPQGHGRRPVTLSPRTEIVASHGAALIASHRRASCRAAESLLRGACSLLTPWRVRARGFDGPPKSGTLLVTTTTVRLGGLIYRRGVTPSALWTAGHVPLRCSARPRAESSDFVCLQARRHAQDFEGDGGQLPQTSCASRRVWYPAPRPLPIMPPLASPPV